MWRFQRASLRSTRFTQMPRIHGSMLVCPMCAGAPRPDSCTESASARAAAADAAGRPLFAPCSCQSAYTEPGSNLFSPPSGTVVNASQAASRNLALRLPRDEVLLICPLAAKFGRQVGHPAHVTLQLAPQQCVCQPLTGQRAKALNQASQTDNPRVLAGHAPVQSLPARTKRQDVLAAGTTFCGAPICTGLHYCSV